MERYQRILEMLDGDAGCREMKQEWEQSRAAFEACADSMPEEIREILWKYPGSLYFLYQWSLQRIAEEMRFPDEL